METQRITYDDDIIAPLAVGDVSRPVAERLAEDAAPGVRAQARRRLSEMGT